MLTLLPLLEGAYGPFQESERSITGGGRGYLEKSASASTPSPNDSEKNDNRGGLSLLLQVGITVIAVVALLFFSALSSALSRTSSPAPIDSVEYGGYPKDYIRKANRENGVWRWQDISHSSHADTGR